MAKKMWTGPVKRLKQQVRTKKVVPGNNRGHQPKKERNAR